MPSFLLHLALNRIAFTPSPAPCNEKNFETFSPPARLYIDREPIAAPRPPMSRHNPIQCRIRSRSRVASPRPCRSGRSVLIEAGGWTVKISFLSTDVHGCPPMSMEVLVSAKKLYQNFTVSLPFYEKMAPLCHLLRGGGSTPPHPVHHPGCPKNMKCEVRPS
jgi:hypothetical protein